MDGWVAALSWRISLCDEERETRVRAQACQMPAIDPGYHVGHAMSTAAGQINPRQRQRNGGPE